MSTIVFISNLLVVIPNSGTNNATANGPVSYTIGVLIALFIMGYLIYSLLKPEKF
jgi:K+-transporting ATPase KdpF subunit